MRFLESAIIFLSIKTFFKANFRDFRPVWPPKPNFPYPPLFSHFSTLCDGIRGIYTFHQREFDYAFGLPAFQGLVYQGKSINNLTRITDLETVSNAEFEISVPIVEWNLNNVCRTWLNQQTFKPGFSSIINSCPKTESSIQNSGKTINMNKYVWLEMDAEDFTPSESFKQFQQVGLITRCYLRSKLPTGETVKCCYFEDQGAFLSSNSSSPHSSASLHLANGQKSEDGSNSELKSELKSEFNAQISCCHDPDSEYCQLYESFRPLPKNTIGDQVVTAEISGSIITTFDGVAFPIVFSGEYLICEMNGLEIFGVIECSNSGTRIIKISVMFDESAFVINNDDEYSMEGANILLLESNFEQDKFYVLQVEPLNILLLIKLPETSGIDLQIKIPADSNLKTGGLFGDVDGNTQNDLAVSLGYNNLQFTENFEEFTVDEWNVFQTSYSKNSEDAHVFNNYFCDDSSLTAEVKEAEIREEAKIVSYCEPQVFISQLLFQEGSEDVLLDGDKLELFYNTESILKCDITVYSHSGNDEFSFELEFMVGSVTLQLKKLSDQKTEVQNEDKTGNSSINHFSFGLSVGFDLKTQLEEILKSTSSTNSFKIPKILVSSKYTDETDEPFSIVEAHPIQLVLCDLTCTESECSPENPDLVPNFAANFVPHYLKRTSCRTKSETILVHEDICTNSTCDFSIGYTTMTDSSLNFSKNLPGFCVPESCDVAVSDRLLVLKACLDLETEAESSLDLCKLGYLSCTGLGSHCNRNHCECKPGTELIMHTESDGECFDIDECSLEESYESETGCQMRCLNTHGSYECSCPPGFILAGNGRSCELRDLCQNQCSDECIQRKGFYSCTVKRIQEFQENLTKQLFIYFMKFLFICPEGSQLEPDIDRFLKTDRHIFIFFTVEPVPPFM